MLKRLLEDAAERQFDWLILDKQSRLGTFNHFEFFAYMQRFIEAGVRVWSVQEGELTSAEIASTFRQVVDSHAEVADQKQKAGNVARRMFRNANNFRFNGGPTPFGYERVCMSPDGVERLRLIEESRVENPGYWRGSKDYKKRRWVPHYMVVYPNGHEERLTQLPGKGKHDWYEFAVSIRSERVDVVRLVYKMYTDGHSRGEIANHLNKTAADRSFQAYWHTCHVEQILDCPLHGGQYEWKRRSMAAYQTISKDGQCVEAVWSKSDPKSRFKRVAPDDRIKADEIRETLRMVDQGLIDRARTRLEFEHANPKTRKKTRNDSYWLRPWLVCGHCGQAHAGPDGHLDEEGQREDLHQLLLPLLGVRLEQGGVGPDRVRQQSGASRSR